MLLYTWYSVCIYMQRYTHRYKLGTKNINFEDFFFFSLLSGPGRREALEVQALGFELFHLRLFLSVAEPSAEN